MDKKFSALRFSEFSKTAATGAIIGAAALLPVTAKANTGSIEIDAANAHWFVNTNVTFSSTTSQFGLSEASLITATVRHDAFDGVFAWHVYTAAPPGPESSNGYRSPGGVVSTTTNSVLGTTQTIAGLTVQGQLWFSTSKAVARSILTLTNPTGADITVTVDNDNNLGSDNNTEILATSSGDATFDASDNWFVSCQASQAPPACDATLDPVLTFAFQGPGGAVRGTSLGSFPTGNAADNPDERFSNIVVPAGQTRALMYLVQLSGNAAAAEADAPTFGSAASVQNAGYLAQLPAGLQANQIVNWSLTGGTIPTLSDWAFGGMAALLGLLGLGSLGMFGRRRTARS